MLGRTRDHNWYAPPLLAGADLTVPVLRAAKFLGARPADRAPVRRDLKGSRIGRPFAIGTLYSKSTRSPGRDFASRATNQGGKESSSS